ncbi:nucleoid-associated protein [Pedobacter sp. ISL-68]|uniref:nucleoid-associated protein n=1 Tax=unclassified Pedobacter TaxID=2628915 RepID=UPI001BEC23D8|nr:MULTISPECIES: nucleoid-associated protein [unclassified Pedobacter]MBT2563760.1 nucleoid-associated protein [Pedobacter sp. ISL-64]MBT2589652.1 nucleoid-associated protein [Pedobacter sp. ISL-68]
MPKESVLTEAEKQSFVIEKFIFHIIIQEELVPLYLDEITLTAVQLDFFKKRFVEVSEGTQFKFADPDQSELFRNCNDLLEDAEGNFLHASKKITYAFQAQHSKNTKDGVLITALVSSGKSKLVFLLKLDNQIVYHYKVSRNRAALEEIKNTFVEDKKAIQKAAIIDISGDRVWQVLATDRSVRSAEAGITEYFAKFLGVIPIETATTLTKKAFRGVGRWAMMNQMDLDPDQESSSYKSRAVSYLANATIFKTKEFIDQVIMDEDADRKDRLTKSLKAFLDDIGISGQSFKPSKSTLSSSTTKNIRQTAEGLKLEWEGDARDSNLQLPKDNERDSEGMLKIVIRTSEIRNIDKGR